MASLKSVLMGEKRRPKKLLPERNPFSGQQFFNAWPYPPSWAVPYNLPPPFWAQRLEPQTPMGTGPHWAPYDPKKMAYMHSPEAGFGNAGWNFGSLAAPGQYGELNVGKEKAPLTGGWVYGLHNIYKDPWYGSGGIAPKA